MTFRRRITVFVLAAFVLLSVSYYTVLQNRVVDAAEVSLVGPRSEVPNTEWEADGSTTVYDSVDERIEKTRPALAAVMADHASDVDEILTVRRDAPAPKFDPNAEIGYVPSDFDRTLFSKLEVTSCEGFTSQVHLPWLKDDIDRVCDEALARGEADTRDLVLVSAIAHVNRRCAAAFQVFAPDYPADERKSRVEFLDRGGFEILVSNEAAEADEHAAQIRDLLDGIREDLDDLVTQETCIEMDPSLDEPLSFEAQAS